MNKLKFEFPTLAREQEVLQYLDELCASDEVLHAINGLIDYKGNYTGWVEKLEKEKAIKPSEELVPAKTFFLVRESDDKMVGMINIRLTLNHNLWNYGGHIGYNIRPSERRKGYNKVNLYLGLYVLDKFGEKMALLDCDKENLGSSATMRALGGKMIYEYFDSEKGITIQKYVIDIKESLRKYKKQFEKMIAEYPK